MAGLTLNEAKFITAAQIKCLSVINDIGISLDRRTDFDAYRLIRRAHGDVHLNQAFDVQHAKFDAGDFWLLAENENKEPIATYCLRRFAVDDFYDLIRSLTLWLRRIRGGTGRNSSEAIAPEDLLGRGTLPQASGTPPVPAQPITHAG